MKVSNACRQCMMDQIRRGYRLVKPTATEATIIATQAEVQSKIEASNIKSMPYIGQIVYQTLNKALNIADPYTELKHLSNERAERLWSHIQPRIATSPDPMYATIVASIIGNTIDYGATDPNQFEIEFETLFQTKLTIEDYSNFRKKVSTAQHMLILGDNAGEMIFDREVVRKLHQYFPKLHLTYSVRGGPMINDVTWEDAQMVGFMHECTVVCGSPSPGIIFEQSSPEFLEAFWNADLIFSKGQGNFESLEDISLSNYNKGTGSLYYLLKIKCEVVAELIHTPINSFVFLEHSKLFSKNNH